MAISRQLLGQTSDPVSREHWVLILLTGQTFFFALTLSLLEIAGTALFLVDFGAEVLPYVYLAIALFVSLLSYGYAELLKRQPLTKVATLAVTSFGGFCFLAWLGLIGPGWRWISFVLMVVFALGYQMIFVVVGGQAGRLFDVRQMKRLFPIVLAGLTVGFMTGGLILPTLTKLLPQTENLLFAAAISMLIGLLLLRLTIARFRSALTPAGNRPNQRFARLPSLPRLLQKPYVRSISLYQMLSAVGTQLVFFIFLDQTELNYPAVEDLTQFFGRFTITLNLLLLVFLAAPAGYLLNRFGLRLGLTANPGVIGLIIVAMLLASIPLSGGFSLLFWLAVGGRILDVTLSVGTTAPAIKATYQAMPATERPIIETAVEGIGVPVAFGLAGLILLIFNAVSSLTFTALILFTVVVTVFWMIAGIWVYRGYGHALRYALSRRLLSETALTLTDGSSLAVIERLLQGTSVRNVRLALDILEAANHKSVNSHLIGLIDHPAAAIRTEALARIEQRRVVAALADVRVRLEVETEPTVKGMALQALCALIEAEAVETVRPYLDDPATDVRLRAMVGLLRYGSIPGILAAGQELAVLKKSSNPAQRAFAAQVIGQVGLASFYQPLSALLVDDSVNVRRAALLASGQIGHARLVPLIIDNLAQPALRSAAMAALIACGEALLPVVEQALVDPTAYDSAITHRLVRATAQIKGEQAIALLKQHLNHPDFELQHQILLALRGCGYRAVPDDMHHLEAALRRNGAHGARTLLARQAIKQDDALVLLRVALGDVLGQVQQRIFLLLSFIHDPRVMRQAGQRLALGQVEEQALVIETLDVTLSGEQKRLVLALVDENMALPQRVKALGIPFAQPTLDEQLHEIIQDTEAWPYLWVRACAIYAVGKLAHQDRLAYQSQIPAIEQARLSPHSYLQETAVWAWQILVSDDRQK